MSETVVAGTAVIPLKETLARRLSASTDCIDTAGGDAEGKLAAAAADTAINTAITAESQLDADEPGTREANP